MSKYTHLFFDLDNTIFDFQASSDVALKSFADALNLPYDDHFREVYHKHNHKAWVNFEHKIIDGTTLRRVRFEDSAAELGRKIDGMMMNRKYLQQLVENPFFLDRAKETMDFFHNSHSLIAVTNGLKEVQRPRLLKVGFEKYFDAIVVSDEIGYAKPEHAYFDYAWQKAGKPDKSRCLMIGDNPFSDIKGGNDFGFDTCYIDAFEKRKEVPEANFRITGLEELYGVVG